MPDLDALKFFLDRKVLEYNTTAFIAADPIAIPHRFTKKQDIETAAFFAAVFAWGNRTTIINKGKELMQLMDNSPHQFMLQHTAQDLRRLSGFKHRTFNYTDLLYFIEFFKFHYTRHDSLEDAFTINQTKNAFSIETGLNNFYNYFFALPDVPRRTLKHIASPAKNATCKRLSMFLRWMVRKDNKGVDFGIWKNIPQASLSIPLDLHVARVARNLKMIERKATDWKTVEELTALLRTFDAKDPAKYDFALFALGVLEKF